MKRLLVVGVVLLAVMTGEGRAQYLPVVPYEGAESTSEEGGCSNPARLWTSAEYLLFWSRQQPVPPLVTTGPADVLGPTGRPGTLGQPTTQVVIGGPIDLGAYSGARFAGGVWLDQQQRFSIEGGYFFLSEQSVGRIVGAPGTPGTAALSVPFVDATTNLPSSTGIAFPRAVGAFGGSAGLVVSQHLQGWEASGCFAFSPADACGLRFELLAGYRGLALDDDLRFLTSSSNTPPAAPDIFRTSDRFQTENDFHGGQVGLRGELCRGQFVVRGAAKVAVGNMHQTTRVSGTLATNDFTGLTNVQTFQGGYLALPTNIGLYSRDTIAFVPEASLSIGWQPRNWLLVTVGYNFLYLSNVLRPGDQIDQRINPTQGPAFFGDPNQNLVGPARPTYQPRTTDLYFHGVTAGLEVRF